MINASAGCLWQISHHKRRAVRDVSIPYAAVAALCMCVCAYTCQDHTVTSGRAVCTERWWRELCQNSVLHLSLFCFCLVFFKHLWQCYSKVCLWCVHCTENSAGQHEYSVIWRCVALCVLLFHHSIHQRTFSSASIDDTAADTWAVEGAHYSTSSGASTGISIAFTFHSSTNNSTAFVILQTMTVQLLSEIVYKPTCQLHTRLELEMKNVKSSFCWRGLWPFLTFKTFHMYMNLYKALEERKNRRTQWVSFTFI